MATKATPVILIVDDDPVARRVLGGIVEQAGYLGIPAESGTEALHVVMREPISLVLLDIQMPGGMDGIEVCHSLASNPSTQHIPVIFATGTQEILHKIRAFRAGAVDFIPRPFEAEEVIARIEVHLRLQKVTRQLKESREELAEANGRLREQAFLLSDQLIAQTAQVERINLKLVRALEKANSFNDDDTGGHVVRVGEFAERIGQLAGCEPEFCGKLLLYAPLHDVGKIGLPDSILKKPGIYTEEERRVMMEHVRVGGDIMAGEEIDPVAQNIVRYHHEKWDGTGYLEGLRGEEIPLEARITALADVYDALRSRRVYKAAMAEEHVLEIIAQEAGKHFDPELAELVLVHRAVLEGVA
jgi:putative two-component system response regulator